MYATCLHCHRALGSNESIEAFPVGRRLAFDAAKGRLWVICPKCERWNLSPIEERWEAVESCERLFRGQKLRAQTDNVGLARLAEGTELIRIGSPLRREFAAWRYGAVLHRRRRRRNVVVAGTGAAVGAVMGVAGFSLPTAALVAAAPFTVLPLFQASVLGLLLIGRFRGTKIVGENGKPLTVSYADLDHTRIIAEPDQPLELYVKHFYGHQTLTGERAGRALGALLARVNRAGAFSGTVNAATEMIAESGDPAQTIARVAKEAERRAGNFEELVAASARAVRSKTIKETLDAQMAVQAKIRAESRVWWTNNGLPIGNAGALHRLPRTYRLALEMALHESSEQRALDEELANLERAWREAEEIAAIADNLLTPRNVTERLDREKDKDPKLPPM